jgi:DNA modification methylase
MKSKISSRLHATAEASATLADDRPSDATKLDYGDLLRTLVRRYQRGKRPVSINFRKLIPALNSADRFNHLIHPYPAKLLVHIPYLFLTNDLLSKPGDLVLDPFCGSGTVLLEAQLANRRAYGADANPMARLIARVKTTPLDAGSTKRTLKEVLKRIPIEPSGERPDVVNLEHWFYPNTARQLQCLQEAIMKVRTPAVLDFLMVCFSVCVRKVSLADPRLSVPVRLRLGQYPKKHPLREKSDSHLRRLRRVRVDEIFSRIAQANIARMERLQTAISRTGLAEILCSDARKLRHEYSLNGSRNKPLADESVQLIITSPPYPGAQKYIRSCSLSLGWLQLCPAADLRAYKACIIGREEFTNAERSRVPKTNIAEAEKLLAVIQSRSPIRAAIAATYLDDMRIAIREMYRVLKPGGHAVMVAANNRVSGLEFCTVDYLRDIAEECGFHLTACFIDAIRSRGLMTKRNHTANVITREWVLILSKGGVPEWGR